MKTIRSKRGCLPALALALAALAALAAGLLYQHSRLHFAPDAQLTITREGGQWQLAWPTVEAAGGYYIHAECEGSLLLEQTVAQPACTIPAAADGRVRIRIQPVRDTRRGRVREWSIADAAAIPWPSLAGFEAAAQADTDTITFTWQGEGADVYLLYQPGQSAPYATSTQPSYTLALGGEGLPLPAYGQTLQFTANMGRLQEDILFCCALAAPCSFVRDDFLGSQITLTATPGEDNIYTLQWNEARGGQYTLQYQTDLITEWTALASVEPSEQPGCTVKLGSGANYRLRVITAGEAAASAPVALSTGLSALYATVWPVEDLQIYSDSTRSQAIGTAKAATAYCVLGEQDGLFCVRTAPGQQGYIDADFCLINLPDYVGELCLYDITNSYHSLYMVHGYGIPDVTGTVIVGYEDVLLANGAYLVPLLYPCAQKLADAAQAALQDGYRLKIYDAYRPREATLEIYQVTGAHLQDPIPEASYSGEPVTDLPAGIPLLHELLAAQLAAQQSAAGEATEAAPAAPAEAAVSGEQNSWLFGGGTEQAGQPGNPQGDTAATAGAEEATAGGDAGAATLPTTPEQTEQPEPEQATGQPQQPEGYLTYYLLMTGGRYRLGSFLAQNGSTHNLGIAMDLTLQSTDTGEELQMQTAMHDLSHYSVLLNNNANADLLASYMLAAGFAPLSSEWWHFQDNDTRDALQLTTYQHEGISLEGWRRDLTGWYYCQSDGSRLTGQAQIDGENCLFDAGGYLQTAEQPSE